jgi:PadR family transcriptional regulator, regulatory protein PadR
MYDHDMAKPIVTRNVARVLKVFLEDLDKPWYGYDLMRATGMASGPTYTVLARLDRAGWLASEMEEGDPAQLGRPGRRYYKLTKEGALTARVELAALQAEIGLPLRALGAPRINPGQV